MTEFTPISVLIGGALIGGSAALLLFLTGALPGSVVSSAVCCSQSGATSLGGWHSSRGCCLRRWSTWPESARRLMSRSTPRPASSS